jgi:hypothetical protein
LLPNSKPKPLEQVLIILNLMYLVATADAKPQAPSTQVNQLLIGQNIQSTNR